MKIKIINKNGNEMYIGNEQESATAIFNFCYQDGDWIIVDFDKKQGYYKIQLEDTMAESIIYVPNNLLIYYIPQASKRLNYSPKSFYGDCHIIKVSEATEEEIYQRRNLALNPYDQPENETFFPHSSANIETRGECVFQSRNAIDGYYYNDSHGSFPYQSWGINKDPKAEYYLDFGRDVLVDEVVLTLRADFPHDNYWEEATILFNDGEEIIMPLVKSEKRQSIKFEPKKISSLVLKKLKKAKGISEFPALTQIEVWGQDIKK